ncbi:DUF4007 family protein [uncultured Bacteroides sp.]|uniref:DUF4007 family protein n=1 Tax=uncultured Bacteroides sp. TaxID=162156 RepID=UPI0026708C8C|nr:DUF4007 family protein [uncultured Bacteroides sp.]
MSRYSFSGHESFHCKSLWLKKGYDYLLDGNSFTDVDAVAKLGVGKNMVTSIRFWLRAFSISKADEITDIATYLFDAENGRDPFAEDLNTLWILHILLVTTRVASIYDLTFVEYQREKKEFSRDELRNFIKRKCSVPEQKNVYNENTIKKDIGVLLKNYVAPKDLKNIEDFSALLIALELIVNKDTDTYSYRVTEPNEIAPEVVLFALLLMSNCDKTISFDSLQQLSLTLCMPIVSLIEVIRLLEKQYPETIVFSDNSGIKNVQFIGSLNKFEVLDRYYNSL